MNKKRNIVAGTIGGWLIALLVLIPLAIVVLASLKSQQEAAGMNLTLPKQFLWENYLEAVKRGNLVRSFFNSLLIASTSAAASIMVSGMAAFVLQRNRTRFHRLVYSFIFLGLMAPINYVATIKVFQIFGLMNSYLGVILLNVALGIPFAVFVFYGFMSSVPTELDEASMLDGCRPGQMYLKVIFPLLKPVAVTAFVLNFLGAWNDFISPLYLLESSEKWPMVMSVYNFFGMHFNEWNMISAVITLSILPVIIIYIAGQKYIVSGMMAGSVKL